MDERTKIGLPDFPRATNQAGPVHGGLTCGVHAALAICRFYRLGQRWDDVLRGLGTNRWGTGGNNVVRFFRRNGRGVRKYPKMVPQDLIGALKRGNPVLVK